MMKYLLYLSVVTLLTACYEDKGNYDYILDSMNEIKEITFTPSAEPSAKGLVIEYLRPLGTDPVTERVMANIDQSLSDNIDNLDFIWIRSYAKDGKQVKDTLYTPGYIDVELKPGVDTEYNVFLEVKDRTTTLAKYIRFTLQTRPVFKNSLFVLHGQSGNMRLGNIDFFRGANILPNAYKEIHPGESVNLFTNAESLAYSAYYNYNFSTYKGFSSHNLCVFTTNGDLMVVDPFGIIQKKFSYPLLPHHDTPFRLKQYVFTGSSANNKDFKCIIGNDGRFYIGSSPFCFFTPGENAMENPLHQSNYEVTAGTMTESAFVLWDNRNKRFLLVAKQGQNYFEREESTAGWSSFMAAPVQDANVDFSNLSEDLQPEGKEAVFAYIQYRENYEKSHPFFVLKDASNKFYLYELTPVSVDKDMRMTIKDDEGDIEDKQAAFIVTAKVLRDFDAQANLATLTYNTWFSDKYLFYAKEGSVYRYNTLNGSITEIYSAPEGYTVSVMKFCLLDTSNANNVLGRRLFIGLNNDKQGAVAELTLSTSSDPEEDTVSFYEGFDAIKDIQFANDYEEQMITN